MPLTSTFERGDERLVLQRYDEQEGLALVITNAEGVRRVPFSAAAALVTFQENMEEFLVRTGWSLAEVVRDYRILRLVVLEYLDESLARPLRLAEVQAVGLALDEAIEASVGRYVRNREDQLRRLEDGVRAQAAALAEADRRKNEFLATLAHELRNPLAPLRKALEVVRLDGNSIEGFTLVLANDERVRARAVVVASGATYRRLDCEVLPSFESASVHYWASPLEGRLCEAQEVALVGAGNSAGQAAVYLASMAAKGWMLVRGRSLDVSMSRYLIERIAAQPNIEVLTHTVVSGLEGADGMGSVTKFTCVKTIEVER